MDKQLLMIDLIHSKLAYILASLTSYSSLDLSKRINDINDDIDLIKKSILDNKMYIDIRDVISLRNDLKELKGRLDDDIKVSLQGHKIACLLFEISTLMRIFIVENESINEDFKEYLSLASEYMYNCGRIVNQHTICFEKKFN